MTRRKNSSGFFALLLGLLLLATPLLALEAGEQLADQGLEKRAVALGDALRCMVCQSESINDSPADLARDLRKLVREKLQAGMSDADILTYVHDRYGDYVLLKPPVKTQTLPLWLGPWAFLAIGIVLFVLTLRAQKRWRKD